MGWLVGKMFTVFGSFLFFCLTLVFSNLFRSPLATFVFQKDCMSQNHVNVDSKGDDKDDDKTNRSLSRTGTPRPKAFKESLNAAFGVLGIKKLPLNEAIANRQTELNQSV